MLHNRGITGGQFGSRMLLRAASAVDVHQEVAPAAILVEGDEIIEMGSPESIGTVTDAQIVEARDEVLLPGLVNVHSHLDLSGPGPWPFGGSFDDWLDRVWQLRADSTPGSMAEAVRRGVELSLAGGTAFIGDIAGVPQVEQIQALRESPIGGVSFPEFFGLGIREAATIDQMRKLLDQVGGSMAGVMCGLSPHAPYSCGPDAIEAAAAMEVPLAIHVAESPAELEFLADGTGPLHELIQRRAGGSEGFNIPRCHPVEYVLSLLGQVPAILVHLNYIESIHLDLLAASQVTVAYCPRASAYFGHPVNGSHPYGDMHARGVPVALGTDSLICLDTPDRISVLDEMRLLHRRDQAPGSMLVEMGTRNGALALGIDPGLVDFSPGRIGGIIAVQGAGRHPGLQDILRTDHPPRWLVPPRPSDLQTVET